MTWEAIFVWVWVIILLALGGYELFAILDGSLRTPPLTHVTVRYSPWWVTMPFLGWLFIHFLVRYINPSYIKALRDLVK